LNLIDKINKLIFPKKITKNVLKDLNDK